MDGAEITQPKPHVLHFSFPNRYLVSSTFLRFQEYYESPRFAGKVFSLEQFMDWYAAQNKGKFTYYEDWSGFNLPSHVFTPFREGKFDPLSQKESWLLERTKAEPEPFYVIGTIQGSDPGYLRHELAHARYALDPGYREKAQNIVAELPHNVRKRCERSIRELGYGDNVLEDELQAYLVSLTDHLKSSARCIPAFTRRLQEALDAQPL